MPRSSLQTAAFLAVVFVLAEAPCLGTVSAACPNGVAGVRFISEAGAETVTETAAVLVDCVLPGRIRPLDSTPYVTPGRTIKTTKEECEIRGGRIITATERDAEESSGDTIDEN